MRYQLRIFLVCSSIMFGVLSIRSLAQAEESPYQVMSDHFFTLLKDGKTSEAVDYLINTNPAMKKVPDDIDRLKSQFNSLPKLMGSYISHSKLIEAKVGGMFIYQHYFVAYDRQPISVRIKYYKPGSTWICYGLQFDGELSDLIQKQADNRLEIDTQY